MALKEKKGRQHRGTRAFRRRAHGERRRTGLVSLLGLVIVLALVGVFGSSYLGATPIGTALRAGFLDNEEASTEQIVNPVVAVEAPAPVSEEAAAAQQAADETAREKAAAAQQAAEAARQEAEQAAAADQEAAALEAEQIAAQEQQEAEAEAQAASEAEQAAQPPALDEKLPTEEGPPKDESTYVAPSDPTMYLSVPKLGISGTTVAGGEAALETGTQLVSGAPWIAGSNTYIAGHRVGFPGTPSDHIFYSLPSLAPGDAVSLTDSNGKVYNYRVSEVFAVTPFDVWVTAPTGSDMVTLQVCTETPDDWWTIGPRLMSSGPESGRFIARAVRV